ncbi:MAG: hypothetical protein P1S60_18800 [Anaerolineae bacterium]|nr:hypothetical protein [Anaerolineae bacterium]
MKHLKRWTVLFLMVAAVLGMSACGSTSANAADMPEATATTIPAQVKDAHLSAVLSVSDTQLDSESVLLTFTLTNNADTALYVLP